MPPLVGRRQPHRWVLADPIVPELDAGAPHRHVQLLPAALLTLLLEGDGKEVPPQIEVGADPQEPLAQDDKAAMCWTPLGLRCCTSIL